MAAIEKLSAFFLLLLIGVLSVDSQTDCASGSVCYPSGVVPDDVTAVDEAYYCCLGKNTTRQPGTDNCTCKVDLQLDEKIQAHADRTKHEGRMCNLQMDGNCTTISGLISLGLGAGGEGSKFQYCCYQDPVERMHSGASVTFVDGDKIEYVLCRCGNYSAPVPTPDPTAYVVPQTGLQRSTGEVCSYDQGCLDRPSLRCRNPSATFCCYGSRGMVTVNKDNRTHCTCTNDVFGEMCETQPIALAETSLSCMAECNTDMSKKSMCTVGAGNTRCCPDNMAIRASNHNGTFTSCTCSASGDTSCAVTVDCLTDCQGKDGSSDGVCSDGKDATVCCPEGQAVQTTYSVINNKGYFTSCTCSAGLKKSCDVSAAARLSLSFSQLGALAATAVLLIVLR